MEASQINLKNIVLQCEDGAPLINIENSHNLFFSQVKSMKPTTVFFSVNGDRSKEIKVQKTDFSTANTQAIFNFGAKKSVLEISR